MKPKVLKRYLALSVDLEKWCREEPEKGFAVSEESELLSFKEAEGKTVTLYEVVFRPIKTGKLTVKKLVSLK